MIGKLFDKMLHEKEDEIDSLSANNLDADSKQSEPKLYERRDLVIALVLFLLALGLRLYFIYFYTDPQNPGDGWAGDTFHHWQIAYLTREIGLDHGFLRLWDLKGMEYFWGPLHPILMMIVFFVQGSVSVVGTRVLSSIFGSVFVAALYLIAKKYWNRLSGVSASLFAAILPVAILDDTFGLLEQIGNALILISIVILEANPLFAGVFLALASMVRAEAWIFGFVILFMARKVFQKPGQLAQLVVGWLIPMILYMKYLLDYTANPIYPVWWNYLANAKGAWATEIIYTPYQLAIKPYLVAWFGVSVVLLALVWWRSRGGRAMFMVFMLIYWVFISGMMGLTHYLTGFQPWFWFIRFFEYPYIFFGFFVSIVLFYYIPTHFKLFNNIFLKIFLSLPILLIAGAAQVGFWPPIMEKYNSTTPYWERTKSTAKAVGEEYKGGTVLIPDGDPNITYALVYFNGIKGKSLMGQMYDPYFYLEDKDPYSNWGENREKILSWIKKDDIRLMLVYVQTERYMKLFEKEPDYFEFVKDVPNTTFKIYRAYPERITLENEQ